MGPEILTYCPRPQKDDKPGPNEDDSIELQDSLAAAFLLGWWAARQFPDKLPGMFGLVDIPTKRVVDDPVDDETDGDVWLPDGKIPSTVVLRMLRFLEEAPPADPAALEALRSIQPEPDDTVEISPEEKRALASGEETHDLGDPGA